MPDSPVPDHPKINVSVPQSARIWNYWMGGKDNFAVDREAGDAYAKVYPSIIPLAKASRQFLVRAVRFLAAELDIRQFLDIGTGLPTMQNTHEVAQQVHPDARIVYVDNDQTVLAHARALLINTSAEGVTGYVDADLHHPARIIADAQHTLNFHQPIAVMFMGVLGHVKDYADVRRIVGETMAAVPPGSYLILWDGIAASTEFTAAQAGYDDTGAVPYVLRTPDQIAQCFQGLELVEPGVVSISRWRHSDETAEAVDGFGGVARKP